MIDPALARALLDPAGVALVGASGDPDKNTGRPLRFLRRHGYAGRVVPVNARRDRVQDEPAWPDLASAPGPVEHALVMVPAAAVLEAVADCARAGVRVVTVYTDGYAEAGEAGRQLQDRLVAAARSAGVRLLGPNSMGVVNVPAGLALTVNAALEVPALLAGGLSLVSQSGTVLGTVLSRGQARGFGFAKLVSVGNEGDLGVAEVVEALVDDPDTRAILLFLEVLRDASGLAAAARRARAAGKPVIAYKLGRSAAGRALARGHSGAVTGTGVAASAWFRAHGILEVEMLEALLELPALVVGRHPPGGRRVAVITTTGGGAATVVDRLGAAGVEPIGAPPGAVRRLEALGLRAGDGPLVDLTMAGTRPGVYGAVLAELLAAPECDAVVAVVGSSGQFHPELAVRPILESAGADKPLAAFIVPEAPESLRLLADAGMAGFRTPEACADALRAFLHWCEPVATPVPDLDPAVARQIEEVQGDILDEAAALALLARLGIPHPPQAVIGEGTAPPPDVGWPVVAKVLSADLSHKTEAGGVVTGIGDPEDLARAAQAIRRRVAEGHPEAVISGILVQRQERGLAEVLLAYRLDPEVGPVVILGAGGVLAEIYRDVAVRPAPVGLATAREMVAEVRGLAPIRGYRGLPRGDCEALARAVVAISALAALPGRRVLEAEVNPLLVRAEGQGVVAVDGLVTLELRAGAPHRPPSMVD